MIAKDTTTEKDIIFHEIVGYSNEFPNKIIRVVLSEQRKNGKVFFTVNSITSGRTPVPATPSSGRRPGRITTSDVDNKSVKILEEKVKEDIATPTPGDSVYEDIAHDIEILNEQGSTKVEIEYID